MANKTTVLLPFFSFLFYLVVVEVRSMGLTKNIP